MATKEIDDLGMTPEQAQAWKNVLLIEQVKQARVAAYMNPLASIIITLALDHTSRTLGDEIGPMTGKLFCAFADMMADTIGENLGQGMAETVRTLREGEAKMVLQYLTGFEKSHETDDAGSADRPDAVN